MIIISEIVNAGKEGGLLIKTGSGAPLARNLFWRLPAVLIRCELCLETRDGRVIRHYTDPGENFSSFPVNERGAYFGEYDRFVICDAPGFFLTSLPVPQNTGARLLAVPRPAEEFIPLSLKSGGTEVRSEPHYRKSDEFTDHRPYIPGDDPRRINWKLYSHTSLGELFVREGEPEPPPHSRLLILLDTEVDHNLYTVDESRRAVDLLCESALTAALEFSDQGMDILIGYTGGRIMGGRATDQRNIGKESIGGHSAEDSLGGAPLNAAELAAALAWPAAIYPSGPFAGKKAAAELPPAPGDRAVLIFALPRATSEISALDRFLKKREAGQETDIVFVYNPSGGKAAEQEEAARICVGLYNGRSGVHAGRTVVSPAQGIVWKLPESGGMT